jgi:diguanylate cyclase (GGDEF)-like protein
VSLDVRSVPRAAWVVAVALIAAPQSRRVLLGTPWVDHVVSAIAAAALGLLVCWLLGRLPQPRDVWRMRALRAVPPLALLVAFAGSLSLAAAVPAALWTGAFARHMGRRAGLIAALAAAIALAAVGAIALGAGALWPWLTASALCAAAAVAAPTIQVAAVGAQHDDPETTIAGPRRRRPSALTGDHAAFGTATVPSRRPVSLGPADADADTRALTGFLEDARALLDADDVVLWRWSASAEELRRIAFAVRGGRGGMRFPLDEGGELVQRAAREGRVVERGSGRDGAPTLLAGCVDRGSQLYGAVSVYAQQGVALPRDAARERVARLSEQMGLLLELLEARHRAESEGARTSALLRAADDFQRNLDEQSLHRAICERALQVTSAVRATFVSWDPERELGETTSATDYERVRPGMPIAAESLVAEACRTLQRLSVPSVPYPARTRIFSDQEGQVRIGSLAIVPLVHEHQAVGAVVVEAAHRDAIGAEEAGTLALLAAVAVPSLEASKRLRAESERAFTDPLTGLANRRAFDERMDHVLNTIDRYGGSVSLILVDLDHFKRVNDGYGHDAGDEVLKAVAQTVAGSVRTIDLAARFGGEEMAILLPRTGLEGARELAERLRRSVANRVISVRGRELRVTASFGVACYPETSEDKRTLFTNADAALYEAKASGRNQVKCARQHKGSKTLIEMV